MTLEAEDRRTMIRLYVEKATGSLNDSKAEGTTCAARVNRAYYTVFYCATALLLTKNIERNSHKVILSNFGQEFMKTGLLPKEYGDSIRELERMRCNADYSPQIEFTEELAKEAAEMADSFYKATMKELDSIR